MAMDAARQGEGIYNYNPCILNSSHRHDGTRQGPVHPQALSILNERNRIMIQCRPAEGVCTDYNPQGRFECCTGVSALRDLKPVWVLPLQLSLVLLQGVLWLPLETRKRQAG